MRKEVFLIALFAAPVTISAQSAFEGTWKFQPASDKFSGTPIVFSLQNGIYECTTCTPPFKVKADGTDQPISGDPYRDTTAVKVVSDHLIEVTDKKAGKVVATSTTTVSPDGNTVTAIFSDSSNTNGGPPVTGKMEAVRTAKGAPGAHLISGSWRGSKFESMSDNGALWTYKLGSDGTITMTEPTGQSYAAKLDGTEAPMKGDPGITSVLVKMVNPNTLEEIDKRGGEVIGVMRMTVAADGKSAEIKYEDKLGNRGSEYSAIKQ